MRTGRGSAAERRYAAGVDDEGWLDQVPGAMPTHRRMIEIEVFDDVERFDLIGRLSDRRPWAVAPEQVAALHTMLLRLSVRRADLIITRAQAQMLDYPHAECPAIQSAFGDLVGLSVTRGFTKEVQARFGRERGCAHLEFLARALAPAVVQAIPSAALRREPPDQAGARVLQGTTWLTNTCHVWAEGGVGMAKLELGWKPGQTYPAPLLEDLQAGRLTSTD